MKAIEQYFHVVLFIMLHVRLQGILTLKFVDVTLSSILNCFPQTLSFMLEVEVLQDENEKLQIISTLESTEEGKMCYEALCQK